MREVGRREGVHGELWEEEEVEVVRQSEREEGN